MKYISNDDGIESGATIEFNLANFLKYSPVSVSCDLAVILPTHGRAAGDPIYAYIKSLLSNSDIEASNSVFSETWIAAHRLFESHFDIINLSIAEFNERCIEVIKWLKSLAKTRLWNWRTVSTGYSSKIQLDFDEPCSVGQEETKGNTLYAEKHSDTIGYVDKDTIEFILGTHSPFTAKQKQAIFAKIEITESSDLKSYHLRNNDTEAAEELGITKQSFQERINACKSKYKKLNLANS